MEPWTVSFGGSYAGRAPDGVVCGLTGVGFREFEGI
jgi:hypothetical protein